jgi:hypothetical protein
VTRRIEATLSLADDHETAARLLSALAALTKAATARSPETWPSKLAQVAADWIGYADQVQYRRPSLGLFRSDDGGEKSLGSIGRPGIGHVMEGGWCR